MWMPLNFYSLTLWRAFVSTTAKTFFLLECYDLINGSHTGGLLEKKIQRLLLVGGKGEQREERLAFYKGIYACARGGCATCGDSRNVLHLGSQR